MLRVLDGANRETEIKEVHGANVVEVATVVIEDAIETVVVVDEESAVTSMEMIEVHTRIVTEIMPEIEAHGDQQAVMMGEIGAKDHRADASY